MTWRSRFRLYVHGGALAFGWRLGLFFGSYGFGPTGFAIRVYVFKWWGELGAGWWDVHEV